MQAPYRLTAMPPSEGGYAYRVELDWEHAIFRGHFPGNPVLPGVYMLDMVKQALGGELAADVHYGELIRCKFLQPVRPVQPQPELVLHIHTPSPGRVEASLVQGGEVAFKLSASYEI